MKYLFLIIVAVFSVCKSNSSENAPEGALQKENQASIMASTDQIIETAAFDLNQDGKVDTIRLWLPKDWEDPGEFTKIAISLGKGRTFEFENTDGWTSFNQSLSAETAQILSGINLLDS
jgi:hypothetical protein